MTPKNIFGILILAITGLIYYTFVFPFKLEAVDTVTLELDNLKTAYNRALEQTSFNTLRLKKQQLSTEDLSILETYIPKNLRSGTFVYNTAQLANQNGLTVKGIQYSVIDTTQTNPQNVEKKLLAEFIFEGRYEAFTSWLSKVENADVLVDVESIRGVRNSNTSEIITFTVKMYAYGINID